MPFETFDPSTTLPQLETKLDTNAAKSQALLDAMGVGEDETNIGTLAGTTGTLAASDTMKEGLEKVSNAVASALTTDSTRTQGDTSRTSRELGVDVDLDSLTAGTIGTTYMPAAGTNAAQYPQDDTLYEVDVRYSGASTPFADGDLITYTLTAEVSGEPYVWVATDLSGGGRSAWTQVAPVATLTESDSTRSTRSLATNADWLAETASGRYVVTYSSGNATGDSLAISSSASAAAITWTIDIYYNSATTGWAIAWCEHDLNGLGTKTHAFYAPLTRAGGDWNDPVADWVGVTAEDTADRAIRPKMLRDNNWTLTQPSSLDATFTGLPQYDRGAATCTVTAKELREAMTVGAGTYYVDVNQSATGTGTSASPYLSIGEALANSDCGTVYIAPGYYGWVDNMTFTGTTWAMAGDVIIRKWPGTNPTQRVFLTSNQDQDNGVWTLDSGSVYALDTQTAAVAVVDPRYYIAETRSFLSYTAVSSVAECEQTPGSFFADSGTPFDDGNNGLYVHTPDGTQPPTGGIFAIRAAEAAGEIGATSNRTIYLEDLTCIGGREGVNYENGAGSDGGMLICKNVHAVNCFSQGFYVTGVEQVFYEDCVGNANGSDGFYYIDNAGKEVTATEVRCEAQFNGAGNGNSVNGSSVHSDSRILRIAGKYSNNEGPCIADVDTSKSWMVECDASDSASSPLNATYEARDAGFFSRDTVQMWVYGGRALGCQFDMRVESTSTINYSEVQFKTSDTAGGATLQEYEQY